MPDDVNVSNHPRRLAFYALGFLRPHLRKMLHEAGFALVPFGFGGADAVVVWGRKPVSKRGIKRAHESGLPVLTVEDGFIRSLRPGWQDPPHSLVLDGRGIYFATQSPNDLATLLDNYQPRSLDKIQAQMDLQIQLGISKYNALHDEDWSKSGYILVIDQVRGDQSIVQGGADAGRFAAALDFALREFPDDEVLIRTHPAGGGYFDAGNAGRAAIIAGNVAPFALLKGAKAVITVTSQMGFDAILLGHKPHVFGAPFYAGRGLSVDHFEMAAKSPVSRAALYDVAINQYPQYFAQDGSKSDAVSEIFALHDEARQNALAHRPLRLENQRAWKIPHMKRFFPQQKGSQILRWGMRQSDEEWVVEDGFLRSRGLGAKLVPPLSLIVDKTGIYFDPTRPSDLEDMIKARAQMNPLEKARAEILRRLLTHNQISKYNLPSTPIELPKGKKILLVVGQVDDDRSVLLGATGKVKNNAELLAQARVDFPDYFLIYKPHPDVMAGLRHGKIDAAQADLIYEGEGLDALWPQIDHLATLTSLSGFEAMLRGIAVTCYGMPFYAGWGLSDDHAPATKRRGEATLAALIYAALIDYPLYLDPKTRRFTSVETIIKRIARGETEYPSALRWGAFVQEKFYRLRDYARKGSRSK